jgi:hypothetical protein
MISIVKENIPKINKLCRKHKVSSFMIAADISDGSYKSDLVVDFGTDGLWQYLGTSSTWIQLTTFSPDGMQ